MAVVSTGLSAAGLRSEFLNRFDGTPTYFQDLCTRIKSSKDAENYRWLGTVPTMREWGTGRKAQGLRVESYNVANQKYETTIEVDRDEISDDQTGQIRIRIGEMAQRAATHKDYLASQLLVNGATAGFLSYDGLTFFNDAHVSGASGNQDNDHTTAIVDKDAPTSAEFMASFKRMCAAMLAFVDDRGEPMNISTSGLVCVVPTTMYHPALEAMNAAVIASTTNVLSGAARVISFPWLNASATDTWYLLKTDGIIRPFIFQDREPIEFASLAGGSEEEFKREKYQYGVRARYAMTYGYWQYGMREVFTTAG